MTPISISIAPVDIASVEGLPPGQSTTAVVDRDEQHGLTHLYFRAPDTGRGYVLSCTSAQLELKVVESEAPAATATAEAAASANAEALASAEAERVATAEAAAAAAAEAAAAATGDEDTGAEAEAPTGAPST